MKILWTPEAIDTFDAIMEYLEKEFSQKQKDNFFFECHDIIDLIEANPYLYKPTNKNNVHSAVIHKYTTLYFEINKQSGSINLLSFFDTRQNPNKKTFL
jgi:plasmid stabilization system protein ParE